MTPLQQQVWNTATAFCIDSNIGAGLVVPIDVMAFCHIESSFDPLARRYEPKLGEASYGLMQILVSTARDRGFEGREEILYGVTENLTFGIRQLAWIGTYLKGHGAGGNGGLDIAAAYNAGVGNVLHGFVPRGYVDQWRKFREFWQGQTKGLTVS